MDALAPLPLGPGADAQAVVDRITGAANSSFSLGMKLLSRPRRQAMRAVYAFCRVVDDIADGDLPGERKRALLQDWRAEIELLFQGAPVSAIGRALVAPVQAHDLPKTEFLQMIDGMEMDANGPIVAPGRDTLFRYNRCVAGTVGLLSMRIFGAWKGEVSHDFALALANALQLTNIVRDVEEDADIGRIYLPAEVLQAAGVRADCATIASDPNLADARRQVGQWAQQFFDQARAGAAHHNRLALAPALAMYGVYRGYLSAMQRTAFRPDGSWVMTKPRKLRHGLSAVLLGPAA